MCDIVRALLVISCLVATYPGRAFACGGPCGFPELRGVLALGETHVIVTNFGLLTQSTATADVWTLTCEESIGDVLLDVKSNGQQLLTSTESGLFASRDGVCSFGAGPTSSASSWFLDFAIAADSTAQAPHLLGVVSNPVESSINLERARGNTFELVHSFGTATAFRHIETTPDFSTIVVAGYASQPRRWQLGWSADGGDSWETYEPEVDAPTSSIDLLRVNPGNANQVFFQVRATPDEGATLWMFDRENESVARLWAGANGEALNGLAVVDEQLWLATAGTTEGHLYRAPLEAPDAFESLVSGPPLACLGVVMDRLFACSADYSAASPFLVAELDVESLSFKPVLTLAALGTTESCGEECAATSDWLHGVYGTQTPPDSGAPSPSPPTTSEPEPEVVPAASRKSGCGVSPRLHAPSGWCIGVGVCLVGVLRRRRLRGVV